MRAVCYDCHIKTVEKLIGKFNPEPGVAELFRRSARELLDRDHDRPNPVIATNIHRLARNIINHTDLYREEKRAVNSLLLGQYDYFKHVLEKQEDPLHMAAKLAVAGNIIDFGAHTVPNDVKLEVERLLRLPLEIDESSKLMEAVAKSGSVLYLGDNAGEIVFDKIFIEYLQHPHLTYAVRGKPVINDVTLIDAEQVGMNEVCRVIQNGYDAPATILENCSEEFKEEFHHADLIISKGQGNYEGLMDSSHPNIFFMLMAKCDPIARLLNTTEGSMIILKNPGPAQV